MVSLFKRNLFGLEKKVRDAVIDEMKNKFNRKDALADENFKRFKDYRNQIDMMEISKFSKVNEEARKEIQLMKEKAL
jgi:hypothetical protein